MAKIGSLVRGVEDVNIFIISDGDAALTGPSIAETVNASYKTRAAERRRARKPFVTTLVARKGVVISGAVTIAGEPLQLPERAASLSTAQTGANRSLQPTAQTKPAVTPIIIQSKARASLTNAAAAPLADVDTLKQSSVFQTNAAPTAELFVASESERTNSGPPKVSSPPLQSEIIQIAPTGLQLETVVAATEAVKSEAASLPATPETKAAPAPTQKPETLAQSSPSVDDSKAGVPSAVVSAPASSPSSLLSPTPVTISAREPSSTNLATTKPELALAASVVTSEPILRPGTMVLIGVALFVSAVGLVFLVVKRQRSAPQSSFISRSMDRL
jgi:hypothetical protein